MGLWKCDEEPTSNSFKCKTDKDGYFVAPTNTIEAPLAYGTVDFTGKLVSPKGISVQGTFSFNSAKKTFKAKAGEAYKFGKFKVEKKNTVKLEGTTEPATPNASLEFEVTYFHCP